MFPSHQAKLVETVRHARAILATDLDGTFLGGSDAQRDDLYTYLTNQTHTALVFVTGRDKDHVRKLIEVDGLPRPQFVIGDVGTTVLDGETFEPVKPVEDWIDRHWPGDAKAQDVLKAHSDHLTLQDVYGGRRRSYFISDLEKALAAKADVEAAGYDGVVSDNTYFDVLPRGIQKGPTLLKFIETLGLTASKVLAAGDTLNDLSLFHTGLASVAVGNREPALEEQLPSHDGVYRASAPGAAGIIEALKHFKLYHIEETAA